MLASVAGYRRPSGDRFRRLESRRTCQLDNPLLAGGAANGLGRTSWNLTIACQNASLCCRDMGRVRELGGWPQVLQRRVPDFGGLVHTEISCHQVEPSVDNPGA